MAPIYDSDVAEDRWSKGEWNHYELWEKVEQRLRRHNRLWIFATIVVFLLLSSIPIVLDQRPHWIALTATRQLAQELSRMKREAAVERVPFRLRFVGSGSLIYEIEKVQSCESPGDGPTTLVRTGSLISPNRMQDYRLLDRVSGDAIAIPGLLEELCYDPLKGSAPFVRGEAIAGFAVAPAKDLTAGRHDRLSVLLLSGPSAEASFE